MKNRVRELRERHGWTQSYLAEAAGVSRQTIHSVESEKYTPSLELAFLLARLFKLKIEDVFDFHFHSHSRG